MSAATQNEMERLRVERDALQQQLNAALEREAALADRCPEGWRVVPKTVTPEMAEAYASDAYGTAQQCHDAVLGAAPAVQVELLTLPPFATRIIEKLRRFDVCAEDGQDVDIGRRWLDMLVHLGLLNRVQRSPALWEMAQQGEDVLEGYATPLPTTRLTRRDLIKQAEALEEWADNSSPNCDAQDVMQQSAYSYAETLRQRAQELTG